MKYLVRLTVEIEAEALNIAEIADIIIAKINLEIDPIVIIRINIIKIKARITIIKIEVIIQNNHSVIIICIGII